MLEKYNLIDFNLMSQAKLDKNNISEQIKYTLINKEIKKTIYINNII